MNKAQVPLSFHKPTLMTAYTLSAPIKKNYAPHSPLEVIKVNRHLINNSLTKNRESCLIGSKMKKTSVERIHNLSLSGKKVPKVMVTKLGLPREDYCHSGYFSTSLEKDISSGNIVR